MMLNPEIATELAEDVFTLSVLHDHELSPVVVMALKDVDFPYNLGLLAIGDESQEAYRIMQEAITLLPATPDTRFMDHLAADYAAIYLTGALGASPYESYWLSEDHLLCQDAMFDMRALYSAAGLAAPNWRQRADDHLVFQLQFLAKLLPKASSDHDWRALTTFMDFHLLRWLPGFSSRVANRCDTSFYAALAIFTNVWCQQLRDLIARHLAEARPSDEEIEAQLRSQKVAMVAEAPIHFMPGIGGPSW